MQARRCSFIIGVMLLSLVARLDANPTINTPPGNASIVMGQSAGATFTVAATASAGSLTYQWQGSTDGGKTWN